MNRREFSRDSVLLGVGTLAGVGTAAALCAAKNCGTRDLRYSDLRDALTKVDVYFES